MPITIGIKTPKFPAWVDKAYQELSEKEKQLIIKTDIYLNIEPKGSEWQISKMVQDNSNRVSILDTIGHCLWALLTTAAFLTWAVMQERGEVQFFEDENEKKEQ